MSSGKYGAGSLLDGACATGLIGNGKRKSRAEARLYIGLIQAGLAVRDRERAQAGVPVLLRTWAQKRKRLAGGEA